MAYSNYLLFNNIFLKNLHPGEDELAAASYLVHESARDWYRNADLSSPSSTAETWIKPLLNQQSLDLAPCGVEEKNAWFIVAPWKRDAPLALCYVVPHTAGLDGHTSEKALPKGQHWMIQAVNLALDLRERPLRWVVLTNGVQWRLLDSQALRRYEAYLEVDLYRLLNGEDDPLAAYLFYRLIRLDNSLEWDETLNCNRLDAFLEQSARATEATEAYLKSAVSDNLDAPGGAGIMAQLCMGTVRAIDPAGTKAFSEQERAAIYRDATYLLYRLLFILYAEARGLLPMDRPDYRAVSLNYVIDEAAELRLHPDKAAAKPTGLWKQLTTLFNAIHYSDEYLGIPPYNGGLFEDQDKPFLTQYEIENVYLAEALCELAFLPDPKGEGPPERIDYCDLSVRHLGSLYEGMIEYQLFIAERELLARRSKDGKVEYLPAADQVMRSTDELIHAGRVYFAQSPHERKATGTHYTAEDLVARLVKQTVGRLLDERWQIFKPKLDEWLAEIEATPDEPTRQRLRHFTDSQLEAFVREQVLSLRICDPAMGSGHFLVYAAHTLTGFTLQTLSSTMWDNPAVDLDPDHWRRQVVERCLYGVDINGMAVELAKLSLWLATMEPGRPLSFLDHHLKQGNSLLGANLAEIIEILNTDEFNRRTPKLIQAEARGQRSFRTLPQVQQRLLQVTDLLERISTREVAERADVEQQEADYEAIQSLLKPYKRIGDLLVARKMGWKVNEADLGTLALVLETDALDKLSDNQQQALEEAEATLDNQRTFHWQLEFSDLSLHAEPSGSFDVVIGNPPFLGGAKISTQIGDAFLAFLKDRYQPSRQNTDLCAYFFRLGFLLLRKKGLLGMVATNTIAEGDTREGGLQVMLLDNGAIIYADRYVTWPGEASVEVNLVAIARTKIQPGPRLLNGAKVACISSWLDDLPELAPNRLAQNQDKAFLGSVIHGSGFLLSKEEARSLITNNPRNASCILPYLIGQDINSDPNHSPSRMAIYFGDRTLEQAKQYPDLLSIVIERVKPYRDKLKGKEYREKWWRYGRDCVELRKKLPSFSRVLIRSRVSELHMIAFVPSNQVLSDATVVFTFDDFFHFALLQSSYHEIWLRRQASSMRTDIRYTPTDCFQTFPFPQALTQANRVVAEQVGRTYDKHRWQVMARTGLGLTQTYNRFHDPRCMDQEIMHLRHLHTRIDQAILACYGWEDIELQHDFYQNDRKKTRFMLPRDAQREIFTRLMALNQHIAAEESTRRLVAGHDAEEENTDDEP